MARLRDFKIENTPDGRRLLRFTTIIVNVGAGPFEVQGSRASTSEPAMTGHQCLYEGSTCTPQSTAVAMGWSGDGHNHWHVIGLEEYELDRLDNGVLVGTGAKTGFCFYDNTRHDLALPGAPASAAYTHCGASSSLSVTMGLSVGWGDTYSWNLAYQWVDITGLAAGGRNTIRSSCPYRVYVDPASVDRLRGATIDVDDSVSGGAITIDNPNEGWADPLAARVSSERPVEY